MQQWTVIKDCSFFSKRNPETGVVGYNILKKGTVLEQVPFTQYSIEERKTLDKAQSRRKDNAKLIQCEWEGVRRTLAVGVDVAPTAREVRRPRPRKR